MSESLATIPPSVPSVPSVIMAAVIARKAPAVLADSKAALCQLRQANDALAMEFMGKALPNCLKIGLHCLKAYLVFCISDPKKRGAMKGKKLVTRDGLDPQSFEGWLATDVPWLKKATAYKYMTALKGLGLGELSTEDDVDEALAEHLRVGPVTLKLLCDQSLDQVTPPADPPPLQQSEFEFIRDGLAAFRVEGEAIIALKPQLLANPDMHRAACARAYLILQELTGTNWAPSDQPDPLATVNPDALTL